MPPTILGAFGDRIGEQYQKIKEELLIQSYYCQESLADEDYALNNSVTVQMSKNFDDMATYDLEFIICTIEANVSLL